MLHYVESSSCSVIRCWRLHSLCWKSRWLSLSNLGKNKSGNADWTKEHQQDNTLYYLYLSLICVWCVQVLSSLMPLLSTMFVLHNEHFDGSVLPLRHCTRVQLNLSQSQFTAHLIQVVHRVMSFPLCNVCFKWTTVMQLITIVHFNTCTVKNHA